MMSEDYFQQYAEPLRLSKVDFDLAPDATRLMVERGYYYPPYLQQEVYLDTLNRADLLGIAQQILSTEYSQKRLVWRQVGEYLEALQRLKQERIWRQEEMERLNGELAWRIDEMANIEAERKYLETSLIDSHAKLENYRNQIAVLENECAILGNERAMLSATLADLRGSTSWKITAPLRWIKIIIRKLYQFLVYWVNVLLHIVRDFMKSLKKILFVIAVKYRNRMNSFRRLTKDKLPKISLIFIEPLFLVIRKFFRPTIKWIFYKTFNNMIYDARSIPVFSKALPVSSGIHTINNFNVSERFEYTEEPFNPNVTIIIPNYNHAQFLTKRLDSVYNQTYSNFNVILLDDNSSDESRIILENYARAYPEITKISFNDRNTGSVFFQWKKAIQLADGDLIWIAESDDFCDINFLESLVYFFMDETVELAYARSVFVGIDDHPVAFAFDDYLSEIGQDKWLFDYVEFAHNEVVNVLGKKNTIPNVSSAIFRKPQNCPLLEDNNWLGMKICGDWIFYLYLIRGGKIAFTNKTRNYYRFHSTNSSTSTYRQPIYYVEHGIVASTIVQLYNVPDSTLYENYGFVKHFWQQNMKNLSDSGLINFYNIDDVLKSRKKRLPNILMVSYAFSIGGGEIFSIRLANELKRKGYGVTFFNFNREPVNINVRNMLYKDIPVYECTRRIGDLDKLLTDLGIEIVHTHHASSEHFFATYMKKAKKSIKHVATMHGMYETLEKIHVDNNLPAIVASVDLWIYIADKNLSLFKAKGLYNKERFLKIGNGMDPPSINLIDRKTLGISESAFIFCLASRAIPEKGWEEAIEIITEARAISGKDIHLLLLGDGPVYESMLTVELPEYIHLLGFRDNPVDYYATSNMGFLPSYFYGESFPLSIIECLFTGNPVIASDIGEIRNMLTMESEMAGAVFLLNNWKIPVKEVAHIAANFAMNKEIYEKARLVAKKVVHRFYMQNVIADYEEVYKQILS